ncbi:hypothetical protein J0X19_11725 [Hymenobacter sp. BT186]|uniref:Uncharacterized protein n=1 Tax=Hymenobacter telluris TaxID=2816474 RepID=A0A939JAZ4_9BACT|nr:hypothetical protein [Hymenobacter telluris]MBO0358616.1 hypothetical protein [Hymenobacter telluris]MBW3374642.1 hypothetical protein [Hymenobacter norwichensis]
MAKTNKGKLKAQLAKALGTNPDMPDDQFVIDCHDAIMVNAETSDQESELNGLLNQFRALVA